MNEFNVDSELLPTINGQRIGNSKRIALLEYIEQYGSITQAAKAVPMSYKAAWDAIDTINNLSTQPLVERQTGGQGGGKSALTEFGRDFLSYYREMHQQHQQLLQRLNNQQSTHYGLWQRMNLQLSADNQLLGQVNKITVGAVNNEVHLQLSCGQELVAIVTQHSCEQMQLAKGVEVVAMIQASAILIALANHNLQVSARNQLRGQIRNIETGTVNNVVTAQITDQLTLSASITRTSAENMQLKIGDNIILLIKAPSIILGRLREY